MPDSPKCPKCFDTEAAGQTYKVAGKQQYKCAKCKETFSASMFKPEDFKWKDEPDVWRVYRASLKEVEITEKQRKDKKILYGS